MREAIIAWIKGFYIQIENGQEVFDQQLYENHSIWWALGMLAALAISSTIIWIISRFIMIQVLHVVVDRTKNPWDDHLVKNKFFRALAHVVPLMFMEYFLSIVFYQYPKLLSYSNKFVIIALLIVAALTVNRLLSSIRDIMQSNSIYRDKPIQSYFQVLKIIATGVIIIVMLSVLTSKSPIFFLTSLGAVSAIMLLIFKDTILGFVGSLQLAANDMIRIGDWVTMEKFGADGDVEEINLATVKVRNFDKTITTIPTYSFISDSFKNWRGMEESDGRRIKRSINVNISSVKFADEGLIEELKKIVVLKEFIETRQVEIKKYNEERGFIGENAVNARRQTNLGLFRRYIEYYLRHKSEINQNMTLMVRQLEPKPTGIPLEIYCFTISKEWVEYENALADIFDHILAMVNHFDLQIFENPSGKDIRGVDFNANNG